MYYDENLIEDIRARNDIVDVISQYVHLEKRGANYFGLCPFHNEKTPSFSVSANKQIFYCFGCGAGGDAFTFLMKYDNLSYPEAIQMLAQRAGIALPEEEVSETAKKARDHRRILLDINKEAAVYYYKMLHSPAGKAGLAYFQKRALKEETIRRFGLGYAPIGWDLLTKYLRKKGYTDQEIIDAGLAVHDEKGGTHDKFRNRVMFPIQDVNRKVIGFGGRVLGDGEPKYLNSPETMIFDKGRNLYGLVYAKNARKGRFILCEGYMDVIAMHQGGFSEAVASLGTAFTAGQAVLLKRYTDQILLSYDSDTAGTKASLRAISILRENGMIGKILHLEPHKDPDEFLREEGAEAFEKRLREAENPFFFEIKQLEKQHHLQDPDEKTRFYREIAKKLCTSFEDPMERENYLQALAAQYGITQELLREQVLHFASQGLMKEAARDPERKTATKVKDDGREDPKLKSQRILLTWLADEPSFFSEASKYLSPSDFTDPLYERVAEVMFQDLAGGTFLPAHVLSLYRDEESQRRISELLTSTLAEVKTDEEKKRAFADLVYDIKKASYEKKMEAVTPEDPDYLRRMIEGKKELEVLSRNLREPRM